jgi:hypothetical protein
MDRRETLKALLSLPAGTPFFTTEPADGSMTVTPLTIQSLDLVVLTAPGHISEDNAVRVKAHLEEYLLKDTGLEHVRVIVLSEGLTLSVIRKGTLESLGNDG